MTPMMFSCAYNAEVYYVFVSPRRSCFAALLLMGSFSQLMAAVPAQIALNNSIREVAVAPQPGPLNPQQAFITRKTLTASEAGAILEFEVVLKMRNLTELQVRVAHGERISFQEMVAKYDPSSADYAKVIDWLSSQGFEITRQDKNHLAIFVRAKVSQIQNALQVSFARVTFEGTEYTSAVTVPSAPANLAPLLVGINGLQPHIKAHKHVIMKPNSVLYPLSPPFIPNDILHSYGEGGNMTGAGQTIAIVIDTFPATTDLTSFWSTYGVNQTINNISFIQVVAGTLPAPSGEETLDTEWSSSIAPGAKVRVYATKDLAANDLDQAYQQIYADVTTHPEYGIHQMSMSYGIGETYTTSSQVQTDDQYFAELASAGVTVFASSGDGGSTPDQNAGATGPLQVESPASDPNVTGVGGTSLADFETGWPLSGGGTSIYFNRPSWQTGPGVPNGTMREVPDVALVADPNTGGAGLFNGNQVTFGGTSWSAPTWAGFCALLNQVRSNANLSLLGTLGPRIYPLLGSDNLRDITSGNNGYSAGVGYDLVTGCGTPLLTTLAQTLGPSPITVLHNFADGTIPQDGSAPQSGLILGSDGNFYGTTSAGGSAGQGCVYKMTPQGAVTILHSFSATSDYNNSVWPTGLIQGSDGNFYGVTSFGGTPDRYNNFYGTVFKMTPQGVVTILHDFGNSSVSNDGQNPNSLIQGTDGNLYGTTEYGGPGAVGVAFKITPQGTYTLLHTFGSPSDDGSGPTGLIEGTDGNFYGTTSGGGPADAGTIFKITPQGVRTTLHSFGDGTVPQDGINPEGSLVQGTDGNFYGTTSNGGAYGGGNVYKITPQGVQTILHQFSIGIVSNDGNEPATGLLLGEDGNFYGTTTFGGDKGAGTIFKITPSGTETILHCIGDGSTTTMDWVENDSQIGLNSLIQTADGSIYGTASGGGSADLGSVFKIFQVNALNFTSPSCTTFTVGYAGTFNVTATGTPAPTFTASGLPSWASLNPSTGVLSGTPPNTTGGPFSVTLTASNGSLPNATQTFTLNVEPPTAPAITNDPLAVTYTTGKAYSFSYQATGFPAPTFALASGSLPPGLTMDSSGYLSGVPTQGGLYTGTISASNAISSAATQTFSITVQQPVTFTSPPLNAVTTVGTPYCFTFQANGYPPPTFSINSGLPSGITLSPNGVLSGTPAVGSYGVYSSTVYASNTAGTYGSSDSQTYTITIQQAPGMNAPPTPSPALLNASYYYDFSQNATGYPTPTYRLTSGAFPTGLTMTSAGILSGTPTSVGTYSGVVTADNGINPAATEMFTITVQSPTAPVFINGSPPAATTSVPYSFTFQASGLPAASLSLTSGNLPPGIYEVGYYSFGPGGLTFVWSGALSGTPTQGGTYNFTVTASNGVNPNVVQNFTITITDTGIATDTPTMPPWGLGILAFLLMGVAAKTVPRQHTRSVE